MSHASDWLRYIPGKVVLCFSHAKSLGTSELFEIAEFGRRKEVFRRLNEGVYVFDDAQMFSFLFGNLEQDLADFFILCLCCQILVETDVILLTRYDILVSI